MRRRSLDTSLGALSVLGLTLSLALGLAACTESAPDTTICVPGERRCEPTPAGKASPAIEQCVAGGKRWEPYRSCEKDERCVNAICEKRLKTCGDKVCDAPAETCNSCEEDCGACCGNGRCEPKFGETFDTCSADCTTLDQGIPSDQKTGDSAPCPHLGEILCRGSCVNTQSSPEHCGSCEAGCWTTCHQGSCAGQAIAVATSTLFACALRRGGSVVCWGDNKSGQLGNGTKTASLVPRPVSTISDAVEVVAGSGYACARTAQGKVFCWGSNWSGELGNGTTTSSPTPVQVLKLSKVKDLAVGWGFTCAALASGKVFCWGNNFHGELGAPAGSFRSVPYETSVSDASAVVAGTGQACALHKDQTVSCWGFNHYGSLGDGTTDSRPTPKKIVGLTHVVKLAASSHHNEICAVNDRHEVLCWGKAVGDEFGAGVETAKVPTKLSLTGVEEVFVGGTFACARLSSGLTQCWGHNDKGQLGDGTIDSGDTKTHSPVTTLIPKDPKTLALGHKYACAINGRVLRCWGQNDDGQLGDGSQQDHATPEKTADPAQ